MDFTVDFISLFARGLYLAAPLLVALVSVIVMAGQVVRRYESWSRFDALYWSFITATTIGYGDLRPTRRVSKALSVLIGIVGLVLTGIMVAIALRAATDAFASYAAQAQLPGAGAAGPRPSP